MAQAIISPPIVPAHGGNHRDREAPGGSPRIFWARRQPPNELAHLLAVHLREENCEHAAPAGTGHCALCIEGHLDDLIAHLIF